MSGTENVFVVPDISCHNCKNTIESGLSAITGVDSVHVDVEQRQVLVRGQRDPAALAADLAQLGYPADGWPSQADD